MNPVSKDSTTAADSAAGASDSAPVTSATAAQPQASAIGTGSTAQTLSKDVTNEISKVDDASSSAGAATGGPTGGETGDNVGAGDTLEAVNTSKSEVASSPTDDSATNSEKDSKGTLSSSTSGTFAKLSAAATGVVAAGAAAVGLGGTEAEADASVDSASANGTSKGNATAESSGNTSTGAGVSSGAQTPNKTSSGAETPNKGGSTLSRGSSFAAAPSKDRSVSQNPSKGSSSFVTPSKASSLADSHNKRSSIAQTPGKAPASATQSPQVPKDASTASQPMSSGIKGVEWAKNTDGTSTPKKELERGQKHYGGEGYSERNKVPTVNGFLDEQRRKTEKEEVMAKARSHVHKQNPLENFKKQGEREVYDPVTGEAVLIKDAEFEDYKTKDNASDASLHKLAPAAAGTGLIDPKSESKRVKKSHSVHKIAPSAVKPSNILYYNFPEPHMDSSYLKHLEEVFRQYAVYIAGGIAGIWLASVLWFRPGWLSLFAITGVFGAFAGGVYLSYGYLYRQVAKEIDNVRLRMHTQRGETYAPPMPESVEWINAFTQVVWPLINPEMFASVVDMIEDVMQASLPGFIDSVKVSDFTIGRHALKIISMRALPDQVQDPEYPREEWIDQGDPGESLLKKAEAKRLAEEGDGKGGKKKKGTAESNEGSSANSISDASADSTDEEQTGDYVNLEVSFAYFGPKGKHQGKEKNISLILEFFLGFHQWFRFPIPIYAAVEKVVGTVRIRLQLVSEAPFIRNCTFTLMGVPKVEAAAIPLMKALPNVLDLPFVSGFVQSSIEAATSIYCAPKSMTINLTEILAGDGIKKDTKALGVLAVTIHHAVDLSPQDKSGSSDPYVVLAFAKFGKPLYSSRVISQDLNPVWEETAFLLVSDDEVRSHEKLSIQLWDEDKLTADDLVGRVEIDVEDLILNPNKMVRRTDRLQGFEDAQDMPGELHWSVAYFDKIPLNPELRQTRGIDPNVHPDLQNRPELKIETPMGEGDTDDVRFTPPDPRYRSGILSVIIHQINNLEAMNVGASAGGLHDRDEGEAGQDGDPSAVDLPSAYCEILKNDDMIFKTRVKQFSSMPFFEAGTETFVRDLDSTVLNIVVRDSRVREHDPVLGIATLQLKEVFAHASQITRLFSLQNGLGYGRANVSLLFKPVAVDLPRELRGWDTGTVVIRGPIRVTPVAGATGEDVNFKAKKMHISTSEAQERLGRSDARVNDDGSIEWDIDEPIRLPTYDKYSSALFFEYGGHSIAIGPLGSKLDGFASFWLRDLVDDEEKDIKIPVITCKDMKTLEQNYINEQTQATHSYKVVAYLTASVTIEHGLDEDHAKYAKNQTERHEFEVFDRTVGQAKIAELNSHAKDDGVIDKDEKKAIERANKKALELRHRGPQQYRSVRTYKWAKDGLKDRLRNSKNKILGQKEKEMVVNSEA